MAIESMSSHTKRVSHFCLKISTAALDINSPLWLNTGYAGANKHSRSSNARFQADSLSLVLLTPAYSLIKT
jgi:hypothetical protein